MNRDQLTVTVLADLQRRIDETRKSLSGDTHEKAFECGHKAGREFARRVAKGDETDSMALLAGMIAGLRESAADLFPEAMSIDVAPGEMLMLHTE